MRVFEFIEAEKANFSIKFMCDRLGVTRQGFYAWRTRPPCERRVHDAGYTAVIKRIHRESRGTYGAPRIQPNWPMTIGSAAAANASLG